MADLQLVPASEEPMPGPASVPAVNAKPSRHSALIRATHWIFVLSFLALLVSGIEILISHPRFYWGENGNVLTPVLFKLPIPSSRSLVPTGYGYVLPDQNGWSRYLHFQSAWLAVLTGLLYATAGSLSGHFRKNLLPRGKDLSWSAFWTTIVRHARFERPECGGGVVLQPVATVELPVRHLCLVSLDDLDGAGDVSGIYVGGSGERHPPGRAPIRAHDSFFCCHGAVVVSSGSCWDGLVCRIPEPHALHDYGPD